MEGAPDNNPGRALAASYPLLPETNRTFSRMGQRMGQSADPFFDPDHFRTVDSLAIRLDVVT